MTVTVRFGPTVGPKLLKPSGNKTTSWGDRQVDRIKLAAAFTSRGAPWLPGASLASCGASDALRGAGKLASVASRDWLRGRVARTRTMIGYNRVSTPADLAPSVLNRIALRKLQWIPPATAHTPKCSVRDFVCPRPRSRLTHLSAHAAVARMLAAAVATHPMRANATGPLRQGTVH